MLSIFFCGLLPEASSMADNALKASNPGGYNLTLLGRFLTAFAVIGGAAGLYVLVMHLLFGKRKRRPKSQTNLPH
ncbi:hypothetical protein [Noviherbaspirillum saxi]|uniref:Uncharacterized protein n=1 Tax=Noviherbaspirillum saxi TaxID=2320863 RepID=A0A3A3FLC5_9BURK|nr:hypothetical protein [Noviherbaspirillum saxi]RJF95531.1 hypothetical protein D3871_19220 [Noviherbaspirillum saxi]